MRVWTWPVALGLLIASGLFSALVADGWGDVWSWLALGLPLVVMARCTFRRDAASFTSASDVKRSRS